MSAKRKPRRWPWLVGVLVVVGAAAATFGAKRASGEPIDEQRVITAVRRDLSLEIVEVGRVEPERQVELKSKVAGVVSEVLVEEGDRVAAGALLLRLDAVDHRREVARTLTEVARQKSSLGFAEARQRRAEEGVRQGVTSQAARELSEGEADEKRWAVAARRVALAAARDRLSYTRLHAPIAGTVIHRGIEPGETVTPGVEAAVDGKPLLTIADLSRLLVKVDLNQIDVARVALGMPVRVEVDALPGKTYAAKVTRIAPASVKRQGKDVDVFPIEALLSDADGGIRPGMSAEVRVDVEKRPQVIALPIEAVRSNAGKHRVTRIVDGPKGPVRKEVEVTLGARNDREVEITAGLEVGDRVLVEPASAAANETKM